MSIYVMSDIHGEGDMFHAMLEQIHFSESDTLYILGDVIDRGPDGIALLQEIRKTPNMIMLMGSHEYMMLRALGYPYDPYDPTSELIREDATEHWYRNGGKVTHDHWKHIRKSLRKEIIQYLLALPLNIDVEVNGKPYKLVHGAPMDEYMNYPGSPSPIHFAVWKRWRRYDTFSGDFTMIFGHTPTKYYQDNVPMELWFGNQCIGIDCGSGYPEEGPNRKYGRLACLRLDDGKVFYSEEECYDH